MIEVGKGELCEDWNLRFVRHAGSGGPNEKEWVQRWLFESNRIGIHCGNFASFNSNRYENGSKNIEYLNNSVREETLVVASYSNLQLRKKYIGLVEPGSREVHAIDLEDRSVVASRSIEESRGEALEFEERYRDFCEFEKTVKIAEWMEVGYERFKPLWHWQTRRTLHGVSTDYDIKRQYVEAVFTGGETPKNIAVLTNDDQEYIAAEWLRNLYSSFRLDAPVGGNLQYIDILGSSEEQRVVGSVTYSSYEESRVEALNSYVGESEAYFFGKGPNPPEDLAEEAHYVSLDEVFDWMDSENTRRQESLHLLLGYENI